MAWIETRLRQLGGAVQGLRGGEMVSVLPRIDTSPCLGEWPLRTFRAAIELTRTQIRLNFGSLDTDRLANMAC